MNRSARVLVEVATETPWHGDRNREFNNTAAGHRGVSNLPAHGTQSLRRNLPSFRARPSPFLLGRTLFRNLPLRIGPGSRVRIVGLVSGGPIVLVQLGEPVVETRARVGTYSLWFQRAIPEPLGVVDLRDPDQEIPPDAAGVIFMGSPASVTEPHPWLPRALDAARSVLTAELPTLGVCFGHQLFCLALGGRVARNKVVEVGTVEVEMTPEAAQDPLFGELPARYQINSSHDDTIVDLPADAPQLLGRSERERNMVLRWGPRAWSVQYHPEMRREETKFSIYWRTPRLEEEGDDPALLLEECNDAPVGVDLLQRFVALVRS